MTDGLPSHLKTHLTLSPTAAAPGSIQLAISCPSIASRARRGTRDTRTRISAGSESRPASDSIQETFHPGCHNRYTGTGSPSLQLFAPVRTNRSAGAFRCALVQRLWPGSGGDPPDLSQVQETPR